MVWIGFVDADRNDSTVVPLNEQMFDTHDHRGSWKWWRSPHANGRPIFYQCTLDVTQVDKKRDDWCD